MNTQTPPTPGSSRSPESHPAAIAASHLTKQYGRTLAVDSVTLSVHPGVVYGFLGPNGAGKTTTLRMLLGLIRPTAGRVRVLGRPAGDPEALARIGAMVESPAFYPYLSGYDNLVVIARHARLPRLRVGPALEAVGLDQRGGDRVSVYSLGMRQRLGVAAALLKDPEILILDEPTNGLDPVGMADMRRLLTALAASGKAVLLSSHQLGEVEHVCHRIGMIVQGRLTVDTTVAEVKGAEGLVVRATPLSSAVRCLADRYGAGRVSSSGDVIELSVDPEQSVVVNRLLLDEGIEVHGVWTRERTLEELFLAQTTRQGGNSRGKGDVR